MGKALGLEAPDDPEDSSGVEIDPAKLRELRRDCHPDRAVHKYQDVKAMSLDVTQRLNNGLV